MKTYNLPQKARCLIFDIDSTLYTCPQYAQEQIDCQIRYYSQLRSIPAEEGRRLIKDFRQTWAKEHGGQTISLGNTFLRLGISIEENVRWRKTLITPEAFLKEDPLLINTLTQLKAHYCLECVTNNPVSIGRRTLQALGISPLIQEVTGLDTCLKSKPAKEMFDHALSSASRALNSKITYSDCISIGDRYDIDLSLPLQYGSGAILINDVQEIYKLPSLLLKTPAPPN